MQHTRHFRTGRSLAVNQTSPNLSRRCHYRTLQRFYRIAIVISLRNSLCVYLFFFVCCDRILVGNIPYEATEEQLKDIFSEVGPVVSFRLVYDRETGKPKGYGFCEYKDQDTALSAMRNLNGYELNGRALRVDNAASEKNKEELKNLQASLGGPPIESPYGPECDPDKAPEAISKAVASLPPEQMFELMKQMKLCIQNNPNEARNMLLQNPQLAYALLQAQVVMRIVEPQVAMAMLHRPNTNIQPLMPSGDAPQVPQAPQPSIAPASNMNHQGPLAQQPNTFTEGPFAGPPASRDFDMRGDSRAEFDRDLRGAPGPAVGHPMARDPRDPRDREIRDPRALQHDPDLRGSQFDPRARAGDPRTARGPEFERPAIPGPFEPPRGTGFPERGNFAQQSPVYEQRDSRGPPLPHTNAGGPSGSSQVRPQAVPPVGRPGAAAPAMGGGPAGIPASPISNQDQEKAALIMQVLQLSDQQIAMLPPEQRQSIMVLKEQIARSAQNQ